jgi:uncharacterized membrane protein
MIEISRWVHSISGAFHVVMAISGLLTGAYLLLASKGTKLHKAIGYIFSGSLLVVNISALFIYDFNNGKPSVFHILIIISMFCLIAGLYPMFKKPVVEGRIKKHIKGMTGASLGLWAAGATEYFVRELAHGLNAAQLIAYSFGITMPFVFLIGWTIWYNIHRTKWGKF